MTNIFPFGIQVCKTLSYLSLLSCSYLVRLWQSQQGQLRHSGEKSTRGRLSVREATSETSATSAQPVRHQQSPQKLNFRHRYHHHSSSRSSLLSEACFIFEQYIYKWQVFKKKNASLSSTDKNQEKKTTKIKKSFY